MKLLLILAVMVGLAGCLHQGPEPPSPTDSAMAYRLNQSLAMPISDPEAVALAQKTCRDFSYIYTPDAISDYLVGFAATQTQSHGTEAGRAIGTLLTYQCPATAQRILTIIDRASS